MSRDHDPFTHAIEAWLDRSDDHEDPDSVLDRVVARLDATPQRRARWPAWRIGFMKNTVRIAFAAAAVVVALIGYQLFVAPSVVGPRPGTGPSVSPSISGSLPSPEQRVDHPSNIQVGFIGLPSTNPNPSTPEAGELVDSYLVHGGGLPFEGSVQLYADGRLIWYMFYDGPAGHNAYSTGYLEQRLTPEGVELVRTHDSLWDKDPLQLPEWLPPSAWEDQTIRAYVPSGYAACLGMIDPAARTPPTDPPPMERSQLLAALPATPADLLRGKEALEMVQPPENYTPECLALTTAEARQLDVALSAAGLERDEDRNRYVLEYLLDAPGPGTWLIVIWFEPRMPDGTIGCSSCG